IGPENIATNATSNKAILLAIYGSSFQIWIIGLIALNHPSRFPMGLNQNHNRTYSKSKGLRLIPVFGGAIQLAIFPRSAPGVIRAPTSSRSCEVGSHSGARASNSACEIKLP